MGRRNFKEKHLDQKVLAIIREELTPLTPAEIAQRLGVSVSGVYKSISRLSYDGLIVRASRFGGYQPAGVTRVYRPQGNLEIFEDEE